MGCSAEPETAIREARRTRCSRLPLSTAHDVSPRTYSVRGVDSAEVRGWLGDDSTLVSSSPVLQLRLVSSILHLVLAPES